MKILFLDESGDHNLEKIDPQYPIFVLAGVILDFEYYSKIARKIIKKTKKELFGTEKIILHTADIYRNRGVFEKLKDSKFRNRFYKEINSLMKKLNFEIVASAIVKKKHLEKYGISAIDPYLLSLEFVVERFMFSLEKAREKGIIIAESRNQQLDNQLGLAWLNLKINGTRFIGPARLTEKIKDFKVVPKNKLIEGLKIADLVAAPIGRALIKKDIKEDFEVIKRKFRKSKDGKILGYGLIVFPRKIKAGPATQSPLS